MARAVDEVRFSLAERALQLLAPFPGRAGFAVRLAVICALTALVVEVYQTPEPALTIYVAFFAVKLDRAVSVLTSIVMVVLVTIIIALLLLLARGVLDHPSWRVAAMALLSFALLFAASSSKLKPVGNTMALVTGYSLDALGSAHVGELATRALLYAWLFVAIPAGLSIAVNLVAGTAPRRLVERALADRLRVAARFLHAPDAQARIAFVQSMREGLGEIPGWLRLSAAERAASPGDIAALHQAAHATCALLPLILQLVDADDLGHTARDRAHLSGCLGEMAEILEGGGYPLDIAFAAGSPPDANEVARATLATIRELLATFAVPPSVMLHGAAKARAGFFAADAFSNPVHVQYALKATAAAMICYLAYSILDWPGIHTCLITCYIVSLGTTAETIEKLSLRIAGCLVGAALGLAGIVFVMPHVTSVVALATIVAGVAFVSAWIAGGSPRISYIGFQIAFAFFLSVVQGSGPAFDMTVVRDRVVGIVFGNLVVAMIFTSVWPVTVATRIDPAIAGVLRSLAALAAETVKWRRWMRTGELQDALNKVEQDIAIARYEPAFVRPSLDWIARRRAVVAAVAACQGPLLLEADCQRGGDRAVALAALAQAFDRAAPRPAACDHGSGGLRRRTPEDAHSVALAGPAVALLEQAVAGAADEGSNGRADHALV